MRKSKVIQLILSLMSSVNIKDKRIKYTLIGILGLGLAAVTQLDESTFGNDVDKLPNESSSIAKVVEKEAGDAVSDVIKGFLKNIF